MKKILAVLMTMLLLVGMLAGCGGAETEKEDMGSETKTETKTDDKKEDTSEEPAEKEKVMLKVWGSQEEQELLAGMVEAFKAENPDKEYTIELGVVGEPDAKTRYLEDPAAAADVFAFANDQLYDLVNAGALYEVTKNKDAIVEANVASSIEAATKDGSLYAYPMTADNGYFMYYDKSVLSEDDVKSMNSMLDAADAAGKKVFMDVSNGWYIASFFLGAGGTLEIVDGVQQTNFNGPNGLVAGEAIKYVTAHPGFLTGDDAVLTGGFGDTIVAGVSGTWNAAAIQEKLGDNYAATKLPEVTAGGTTFQMSSFAGFKLVGVNSLTEYPVDALAFAEFITNEENQVKRFEAREIGPSNKMAGQADAVKANIALAALAMQSAHAVSQKDVAGSYWGPAEAFGTTMEAKDYSQSIQELLDAMVEQIQQ
jgi:arabinogalactan oligomer/maltooligosaccharide transport system substrate-binding protein